MRVTSTDLPSGPPSTCTCPAWMMYISRPISPCREEGSWLGCPETGRPHGCPKQHLPEIPMTTLPCPSSQNISMVLTLEHSHLSIPKTPTSFPLLSCCSELQQVSLCRGPAATEGVFAPNPLPVRCPGFPQCPAQPGHDSQASHYLLAHVVIGQVDH